VSILSYSPNSQKLIVENSLVHSFAIHRRLAALLCATSEKRTAMRKNDTGGGSRRQRSSPYRPSTHSD
jgi:hypothetical protein